MNINDNDVKVLGRVVAITTENKVAEAEQVWDGKFSYNFGGETLGATDQHTINELFAGKILALDAAGLISNGDTLNITKNISFAEGKGISLNKIYGNLAVTGKLTANSAQIDGKLTAQEIETDDLTVNSSLTGATNASLDWNGPVNIDGNVKVRGSNHTVRIDGDLSAGTISGPKATTNKFGVVRLATGLDDPDANDVVTVATMKDCCDDVKARLTALEEAIANFKYSVVNHSAVATLEVTIDGAPIAEILPGNTATKVISKNDRNCNIAVDAGSYVLDTCKIYINNNGGQELRYSQDNIGENILRVDLDDIEGTITGTVHVYTTQQGDEPAVEYEVIKDPQNVTIGGPSSVIDGYPAQWPITPDDGYVVDQVFVIMGGQIMPESVWDGTKVYIPSVTGHVTITAVGKAEQPPQPGEFDVTPRFHTYANTDTSNKTFTVTSSGSWTTSTSDTELIDITGGSGSTSGSFQVRFKTVNNTGEIRAAEINVTSGGETIKVVVTQLTGAVENKLYTKFIGSSISRDGSAVGTSVSAEDSEQPLWESMYIDNIENVTADSVEYTVAATKGPGQYKTESIVGTATDQLFHWPAKSTTMAKRTGKVIFSKDEQTVELLGYSVSGNRSYSGTATAQTISTTFCTPTLVSSNEALSTPGSTTYLPNWITVSEEWSTVEDAVPVYQNALRKTTIHISENTNAEDRQADIYFGDTPYTIVQAGTDSDYVFARILPVEEPIVQHTNAPMLLSTNAVIRGTRGRFFVHSGDALYSRNTQTYINDLTRFTIGGVDKKQQALTDGWVIPNGYNAYVDIPASEMTGDVEMAFSTHEYTGNVGASPINYSIGNNISILNKLCQYMGSPLGGPVAYHPTIKLKAYPYFKIDSLKVNDTEVSDPSGTYSGFTVDLTDGVYTITLLSKMEWNISASAVIA